MVSSILHRVTARFAFATRTDGINITTSFSLTADGLMTDMNVPIRVPSLWDKIHQQRACRGDDSYRNQILFTELIIGLDPVKLKFGAVLERLGRLRGSSG